MKKITLTLAAMALIAACSQPFNGGYVVEKKYTPSSTVLYPVAAGYTAVLIPIETEELYAIYCASDSVTGKVRRIYVDAETFYRVNVGQHVTKGDLRRPCKTKKRNP
jgi:hypothetical protein